MITSLLENFPNDIQILPKRCLRRRLNSYSCTLCIDSCPSQALKLIENNVHLDQFQCTDCARCVAVCPNEAFESTRSNIYSDIKNKKTGSLLFSCYRQQAGTSEEVIVPCLGIISPEVILYLTSSNYKSVSLNTETCATCINSIAIESLLKSIELLFADFPQYFNLEINFSNKRIKNSKITSNERRSFLRTIGGEVSGLVSKQISGKMTCENSSRNTGRRLPAKRKLLNESPFFNSSNFPTSLYPQMLLSEECTFCPRCTGMCPTGALKIARSKNDKILTFAPVLCSECGLCEEFCKKKAITILKILTN